MEPQIQEPGAGRHHDERDGDRPDAGLEDRHEVPADDPLSGRAEGERDPIQDAEGGQCGDDRRDLQASDQGRVDQAEPDATEEDEAHPGQDLGGPRVRSDAVGGDDHAQADHSRHREVEVPHQEGMRLTNGDHDQWEREDQDL
jgi:hypothetical protein